MKQLSLVVLICICGSYFSQEQRTIPLVSQGSDALQIEALVYYNNACELVKTGQDSSAETQLLKAISKSMTLVEAQRFLSEIYFKQGRYEEALIYINSAIDFYTDQEPHYYFSLFDLAMRFGEYSYAQHAMKHFQKKYGQQAEIVPYEPNFPFTPNDYEYYSSSIRLVYNYTHWKGNVQLQQITDAHFSDVAALYGKKMLTTGADNSLTISKMKQKRTGYVPKIKKQLPVTEFPMYHANKECMIYGKTVANQTDLYIKWKKGNKWVNETKLPLAINGTAWEGHPWLSKDGTNLYFSSDRNGSKDLFVAKIDLPTMTVSEVKSLDWINSYKDEIAPSFNEDETKFYFSSNGLAGFGGFDLFQCHEFERQSGIVAPQNPKNRKYPLNSQDDELSYDMLPNGNTAILVRKDIYGRISNWEVNFLPESTEVNFELPIKFPELNAQ